MYYKTIVLGLLEQYPLLHEQLRQEHKLLSTLDRYALDLKNLHEFRLEQLAQAKPESALLQLTSESLELAIRDLEDRLPNESPPKQDEFLSLERAMNYVRNPTSHD